MTPEKWARLKDIFPAFWNPSNPIDAWGTGWDPERFEKTLDIVAADPAAVSLGVA